MSFKNDNNGPTVFSFASSSANHLFSGRFCYRIPILSKFLSRITRKRKQELTGISDVDSASNLEPHTEDSLGLWAEPQIQPSPDIRFPPLAQEVSIQAPPTQGPPTSAPLATLASIPSVPAPLTQVFSTEQATLAKETVTPEDFVTSNKVVTPNNVVATRKISITRLLNTGIVDEIQNAGDKADEKSRLVEQAHNQKDKKLMLTQLPTQLLYVVSELSTNHFVAYHPHYKETLECAYDPFFRPLPQLSSLPGDLPDYVGKFAVYHLHYKEKPGITESAYDPFLLRPPPKLLSPGTSSYCIIEVINPLHDIPDTGKHWFAIHHPHYKDEQVSNPTWTSVCAANCLYFGYSLSNLSTAPACAAEPGLVMKKGEPPRTLLHLLSHQPPSLLLSSTLSEIRSAIFEYLAMPQYVPVMSEWQFSSTLAVEDRKYLTFTQNLPNASFDLSRTAQKVEFLPDDIAVLDKQLQSRITNNSRGLRYDRDTLPVLAAELYATSHGSDIEKRHWGRYQIVRKKSYQHQHYGMCGTGKHEIGKYETGEYWHLATFRKSCQCRDVGSQLMLG